MSSWSWLRREEPGTETHLGLRCLILRGPQDRTGHGEEMERKWDEVLLLLAGYCYLVLCTLGAASRWTRGATRVRQQRR